MPPKYRFKEVNFADSAPAQCYECHNLIYGVGIKLSLWRNYVLSFHRNCFNKTQKSINNGFVFVRKIPIIIRAKKMEKDTEVQTKSGEKITIKAGEYMMIGIEGEKYPCDQEIFDKTYEVFPNE